MPQPRPSDELIIAVLADAFRAEPAQVIDWLAGMDLEAVRKSIALEMQE